MTENKQDKLRLNVVLEISSQTLQAIVAIAKRTAGKDANGAYRVDTADKVGETVNMFLNEKDFDTYIKDLSQIH